MEQTISYDYASDLSPEMDLLAASSIGDLGLVHRLLQQGANVDLTNESGWTPLMYAAHYGHYNVVKMLIDYGANVNVSEKMQERTPLMLAASCGHTRCLEVLITLGAADIEMTDSQGHNAAYYAIHSGHGRNKIIAKLLKIQGKSRSSTTNSNSQSSSNAASAPPSTGSSAPFTHSSGGSRIRPLTKGRPDSSSTRENSSNGKHNHNTSKGYYNGTTSSTRIAAKPEIIVSQDNVGPIIENSSPFSSTYNGNGTTNHSKSNDDNDNCAYYSPYLPLSRDGSPIGGNFSIPSLSQYISPSSSISSPFNVNDGLTPQLTFDRLINKRRLPMGNPNERYSGQPPVKTFRRDQPTNTSTSQVTSSVAAYNYNGLLTSVATDGSSSQFAHSTSNTSSNAGQFRNGLCSTLTTITEPISTAESGVPSEGGLTPKEMNSLIDEACRFNSLNGLSLSKRPGPGVIGSEMKSKSPSTLKLQPQQRSLSIESPNGLSDASTSSSTCSSLDQSQSPLPEDLDTLLERIGLSQYSPLFSAHGIDLYCFLTLNESDFEDIGITLLGHKRKLYMSQLRFRESVEIISTQERFFADWLLSERENLKKENHELKMKLKGVDGVTESFSIYNQLVAS